MLGSVQRDRYSRQLLIDIFDESDQHRLLDASILVVGAGGLGSAVIQYLAGAGVGHLGIVDDGDIKRSNLHRQTIHAVGNVGQSKVDSAAHFVEQLNPDVAVDRYPRKLQPDNAESIVSGYDLVVDCLDGFPARFLLNDVTQLVEIPLVHGAVYGFEGQFAAFDSGGPCYRCLYPRAPEDGMTPSDEPMAVFPPVPGIIGCIQALESLKHLLQIGDVHTDRLLRFHGLDGAFSTAPLEAKPGCPVCGSHAIESIESVDYTGDCRIEG